VTRKDELQVLLKRFGSCRCTEACPMEQYGENGADDKPRGRFAVCELEADMWRLLLPEAPMEVEP
jgi:hypothetical protein